jgi:beta-xylosidase
MKNIKDLNVRDPFILLDDGKYYLYKTLRNRFGEWIKGVEVLISDDLENFSDPIPAFVPDDDFWGIRDFWAPEVKKYNGKYYMFVSHDYTSKDEGYLHGVSISVADKPTGPFKPLINDMITPRGWDCIDGSMFVDDDGQVYLYFVRQWPALYDGQMYAAKLSPDLKKIIGEPQLIFTAKDSIYSHIVQNGPYFGYVTDGPFVIKYKGLYLLTWSTFNTFHNYVISLATSTTPIGQFNCKYPPLFTDNGGHSMIFKDKDEKLKIVFHSPNQPLGKERMHILDFEELLKGVKI